MGKNKQLYDDYLDNGDSEQSPKPEGYGNAFLTRAQRNQAAFAHAIRSRCGCSTENCEDCSYRDMWGGLLASNSGEMPREY
jgi:hypothetical protein